MQAPLCFAMPAPGASKTPVTAKPKPMKSLSLLLIACCFFRPAALADPGPGPAGTWQGLLEAGGMKVRLVFHIRKEGNALQATMDSPDQGAKDIPVSSVLYRGDSLLLTAGPVSYKGRFQDDSTINGVFVQGIQVPLTLHRAELTARVRPQTPKPPFPYLSEDVIFRSKDSSITYGATITAPRDGKRHPAILLLSGSGQQNRDGEILEHKPFAVWADYLSRRGFVVLRVDDRGTGKTKGPVLTATSADFAGDAGNALDFLKTRPEVDPARLGVIGHSEGGMIATMLAASRNDIACIVSMAGPGVPTSELLLKQNDAIGAKRGLSPQARKAYGTLYAAVLQTTRTNENATLGAAIAQTVQDWVAATPPELVLQTTGIRDSATLYSVNAAFIRQLVIPWFRYFIAYDPQPLISTIRCRVLAINGTEDIQVDAGSNLAGWEAALRKGKPKAYEVKAFPGLNHLFQACTRCDLEEYGQLNQTISPAVLEYVSAWLAKSVK